MPLVSVRIGSFLTEVLTLINLNTDHPYPDLGNNTPTHIALSDLQQYIPGI